MGKIKKSYEQAAIRVCIDYAEGQDIQGQLHSAYDEAPIIFNNVAELLVALEDISEHRGFPEAVFRMRRFASLFGKNKKRQKKEEISVLRSSEELEKMMGKKETFRLYVTGRRNAGLQGHFVCVGTGNVYQYTSELELLSQMEDIILTKKGENIHSIVL